MYWVSHSHFKEVFSGKVQRKDNYFPWKITIFKLTFIKCVLSHTIFHKLQHPIIFR